MNVTGGLTCGEWFQSGGVKVPSCFPKEATVMTRSGTKAIAELSKGEEILGFDHSTGRPVFTAVRAWLHHDPNPEVMMAEIETDKGTLVASNKHLLAVQGGEDYEFAGDLKVGSDTLLTKDGTNAMVKKVSAVSAHGLYAPLTYTSNFFVGGKDEVPGVLAHSFAQVQRPRRYEALFHRFLDVAEFLWPSVNDLNAPSEEAYIHPVARVWMWLAGIPTTELMSIRRSIQMPNGQGFDTIDKPLDAKEESRSKKDCDEEAEEMHARRLAEARKLTSSGSNNNQQNLLLILLSVVQIMPPFLRHGVIPTGTPGFSAGLQPGLVDESKIEEWLQGARRNNLIYVIVGTVFGCCCWCLWCFCAFIGEAGKGGATQMEGGARQFDESELSRLSQE